MMRCTCRIALIILSVMLGFGVCSFAQTVTNVTATQVDKNIHVTYHLDQQAEISLYLSTDGGQTYTELHEVSGDVGKSITAGHKIIVWDVLAERERLVGENIVFKVMAQGGGGNLEFTVNGVTFKMIYVKGGTFTMGCTWGQESDCYPGNKPSHQVTLSGFWMGETEVTQALWQVVMNTTVREQRDKTNPILVLLGEGANYPMYFVNYNEAVEFCNTLNSKLSGRLPSGYRFALPTEAQWEYAARGGNKSKGYKYAGGNTIGDVAWYTDNSSLRSHPVKGKQANELGLYDMSGNLEEWCSDWYSSSYYFSSSQTNPTGPSSGLHRVRRGGHMHNISMDCTVAHRDYGSPDCRGHWHGFRIALVQQ